MEAQQNRPAPPTSRQKILDVAEARFAQRGYAGVGLREVAEATGLGKSSLFHHFPSKASLYLSVLERVMGRIDARVSPALSREGTPVARLERVVEALIDALVEHPTTARLLLRGLFEDDDLPEEARAESEAFEETLHSLVARLEELLQEGVSCGAFRPASPAHVLQTVIGATVYHFASGDFGEQLTGGPLFCAEAVRRRKEETVRLLRHGLENPRPPVSGGEPS